MEWTAGGAGEDRREEFPLFFFLIVSYPLGTNFFLSPAVSVQKQNTEQSLAKITPALQATVYVLRRTQLLPPNSDHVMNPLAGCNCIIFNPRLSALE